MAGFDAQVTMTDKLLAQDGEDLTQKAQEGLILVVPMNNPKDKGIEAKEGWRALYGSVLKGFHTVSKDTTIQNENEAYRRMSLEAALKQASDSENKHWHLHWNDELERYEGVLQDLPSEVGNYIFVNPEEGNVLMAYYLFTPTDDLFKDCQTDDEKCQKLQQLVAQGNIENLVDQYQSNLKLLNMDSFNRQFYSRIYIPDKERKLRLLKQNEDGQPLQGAEFTLYSDENCTTPVAKGITDKQGSISFSVSNTGDNVINKPDGTLSSHVHYALEPNRDMNTGEMIAKRLWMKETKPPEGYLSTPTKIKVMITNNYLYVDAGDDTDDVAVAKGIGRLVDTMVRYASDGVIDVTLRDITVNKYLYNGETDDQGFPTDVENKNFWMLDVSDNALDLHFGLPGALLDYGPHHETKEKSPTFRTETGWIGIGVSQNYNIHNKPSDAYYNEYANETDLRPMNISHLFTGSTIIVVKDHPAVKLTVKKNVTYEPNAPDIAGKVFAFTAVVKENNMAYTKPIEYMHTAADQTQTSGTIDPDQNGTLSFELKDQESITFSLPKDCNVQVTETEANQNGIETSIAVEPDNTGTLIDDKAGTVSHDHLVNDAVITYTNKQKSFIEFGFTKVASEDNTQKLNDAEFKLYALTCTDSSHDHHDDIVDPNQPGPCWTLKDTQTSNPDVTFKNLYLNEEYQLVETQAPKGRVLPAGQWRIKINESGTITVTEVQKGYRKPPAFVQQTDGQSKAVWLLPNMRPIDVPASGGFGAIPYLIGGGLLMLLAGGVILLIKRNNQNITSNKS